MFYDCISSCEKKDNHTSVQWPTRHTVCTHIFMLNNFTNYIKKELLCTLTKNSHTTVIHSHCHTHDYVMSLTPTAPIHNYIQIICEIIRRDEHPILYFLIITVGWSNIIHFLWMCSRFFPCLWQMTFTYLTAVTWSRMWAFLHRLLSSYQFVYYG